MCLVFHDSTIRAAKGSLELVDASIGHWHLLELVDVCLLLGVDAVDCRPGRIHVVLMTFCCLAAESICRFETVHILFFLIFINVLLFHHHLFIKPLILFVRMLYMH